MGAVARGTRWRSGSAPAISGGRRRRGRFRCLLPCFFGGVSQEYPERSRGVGLGGQLASELYCARFDQFAALCGLQRSFECRISRVEIIVRGRDYLGGEEGEVVLGASGFEGTGFVRRW